ncbi:MAG: DUF502 domain-containing protein [Xanthobacteraceae bacterium]|nr:DUF502 domain-containing protein [Xanthobacteraceae bacterium]
MSNTDPHAPAGTGGQTDHAEAHTSVVSRIRTYFLTGLILVGPVYITLSLTWWFINWVDDVVRPFMPAAIRLDTYLPFNIPGSGLIIAFSTLTLLGFLTANFVGRKLVAFGEQILNFTPIVRPIYRSLKQVFETLFSKSGSSFRRVGLVEFPAPGMWSIVFMSQPPSPDVADRLPEAEHISVFLPCTPNPTTGFFFYVPRRDVIELDITVETAMTLVISAGVAQPGAGAADHQRSLATLANAARGVRETKSPSTSPSERPIAPAK